MSKYDNRYGIDVEKYCTRHACLDCDYFDSVHLTEINKNCPLLPLKEEALVEGYEKMFNVKIPRANK